MSSKHVLSFSLSAVTLMTTMHNMTDFSFVHVHVQMEANSKVGSKFLFFNCTQVYKHTQDT